MTLFTLTPVSTPPEKEDWYLTFSNDATLYNRLCHFGDDEWQDPDPNFTHYLRPISEEKLREVIGSVWDNGNEWCNTDTSMNDRETSITNAIKALQNGK